MFRHVHWLDLVPACIAILTPLAVGIYQSRNNSKTVNSYLLGDKSMSVPAIFLSHVSASLSITALLGVPTELYIYGAAQFTAVIAFAAIGLVQTYILIPVVYELQLLSLFEYFERRFNRKVRQTISLINAIWEVTYTATTTYGCALVFSQILGVNVFLSTSLILGICTLYTTLGGYKGVIYSDVFQCLVMWGCLIMIFVLGMQRAGGPKKFIEIISQSDRFEFFIYSLDPKLRTNVWNIVIGDFFVRAMTQMGSTAYQRSISLPTLKKAKMPNLLATVIMVCYIVLSYSTGFMLYVAYRGCDPTTAQLTAKYDLTMVHFVQSIGRSVPGVVGVFLAAALCASLSTMASCLNNASGVIYRDFIQVLFKRPPTDSQDSRNIKILCALLGALIWVIAVSLQKIGTLMTVSTSFGGLIGGVFFAVFAIGLFMPQVGSKGVLCAVVPWLCIIIYVILAKLTATSLQYPTKVLRVDECPFNVTAPLRNSSLPIDEEVWERTNFISKISPFWFSTIGFVFVLFVSVTSSFLLNESRDANNVDSQLLSPIIRKSRRKLEERELQAFMTSASEMNKYRDQNKIVKYTTD